MSIKYNNTTLSVIKYNNTELDKVIYNDTTVYQRIVVNYYCENSVYRSVKVVSGNNVDLSSSNAASKSGWTFLGWRTDKTANGTVQSSIIAGTSTINLYAVYRQTITLSYNGNGATSGSTASQSGYRYYNNGNITNPSFVLRSNGFSRTNYKFVNWRMGSSSGTAYNAGASVTLSSNTTFYATWKVVYSTTTLKYYSEEIRVGGDGMRMLGTGSTRDGGTPATVPIRTISGNAVSWADSSGKNLYIKANCACSVTITGSSVLSPTDGWIWYGIRIQLFKNNSGVHDFVWGGFEGNASSADRTYNFSSYTINLVAGNTLYLAASGGHDADMGDRSGIYTSVNMTIKPT